MFRSIILCLILSIIAINIASAIQNSGKFQVISIESGQVRGQKLRTLIENREYYAFRGIPFAQTPIGNLRFKAPKKVLPWNGTVLDAFEYKRVCSQVIEMVHYGDEDCLHINVFVPGIECTI